MRRAMRTIAENEQKNRAINGINNQPDLFERKVESVIDKFTQRSVQGDSDVDEPLNKY